jgi:hypothetical protein
VSNPTSPGFAPAGWYPTAPGSPQLRWWDGRQWTENVHTLGATSVPAETAPAGTSPYTAWIWIYALLPLVQFAELPILSSFYTRVFAAGLRDPSAITAAEYAPGSGFLVIEGLAFVLLAIYVVLALLDFRALKARGVPRPFHWAWSFFGFFSPLVYIIGRTVVVRRRVGSGLAPIWVNIVAIVVGVVGILAVLAPIILSAVDAAVTTAG